MKIRLSLVEDIPRIETILDDAKELLKSLNIDQWQNGYPNTTQIKNDIEKRESYVVVNNENTIVATTMFTLKPDTTYKKVIDGNWFIDEKQPYGVIHRLAMSKDFRGKGIAKFVFEHFHNFLQQKGIKSLKIDTHEHNVGMQSLIKKMGYKYCGIIYTSYGSKRLAFEKIIS